VSEINVELDGKKTWPGLDHVEGKLTGVALQTNEDLSTGDGLPSVKLRIEVPDGDETPLTIIADVKLAHLIPILASVKGRLEHLLSIRQMVNSIGGKT
jgi:hypothetical protein